MRISPDCVLFRLWCAVGVFATLIAKTMKIKLASSLLVVSVLVGCVTSPPPVPLGKTDKVETTPDGTSMAASSDAYKQDVAQRISHVSSTKVYTGRPQALLRSVIVMKYAIDKDGNLLRSEIIRTNHDAETEATAMATLRSAAPFPKPASHLLRHGRLELSESWLFNNDGRFQLRSVAQPQLAE